jgi:hypothetical protein
MTIEEIRSYRNAKPFQPFDIVMTDGTVYYVELGERIALSPTGRAAWVFEGSDLSCVDVSRVSAVKPHEHKPRRRRSRQ